MIRTILLATTLAAFATAASAQDKRPDYGTDINATGAKKIAASDFAVAAGIKPGDRFENGSVAS